MKVELVAEGSPDCPLVRFYSSDPAEFRRLRHIASSLAEDDDRWEELAAAVGFILLDLRSVCLTNTRDVGMIGERGGSLEWALSRDAWEAVAELIDPLCSPDALGSFQWLDEAGRGFSSGLAVVASVSAEGGW